MKRTLNNLIKEELFQGLNQLTDVVLVKENGYKLNEKLSTDKRRLYQKSTSTIESTIDIYLDRIPNFKYYVSCNTRVIIDSVSMADPTKRYQTTSASRIKQRNIQDREYMNDIQDVIKYILKHLRKINKLVG